MCALLEFDSDFIGMMRRRKWTTGLTIFLNFLFLIKLGGYVVQFKIDVMYIFGGLLNFEICNC